MAGIYNDPNAVLKDLHSTFEDTVRLVRPTSVPKICTKVDSDGAYEKYVFPTAPALPRQWVDQRSPQGVDVNATFQVNNNTYELTLDFKRELLEDSKAYDLTEVVREAALAAVMYPDYLLSSSIVKNGNQSGNNAYDGNTFYGGTHLFGGGGANNINNLYTSTGVTLAALQADLQGAIAALQGFLDNAGRLVNLQSAEGADKLLIQCPLAIQYDMKRVLNLGWLPITSSVAGENIFKGTADILPDGYLSSTTPWFLHYTGLPLKPFVWQDRMPLETSVLGFSSEFCQNSGRVRIMTRQRFRLNYFAFYRSIRVA